LATRNPLPDRRVASFFAVGSPELAAPAAGSAASLQPVNMMRQLRELPTLPATEPELRSLGTALAARRQRILVGSAATEASLGREDLSGFDVVAFATHGLTAGEIDGLDEAALVLTPSGSDDGLLTASEVMRLRLAADWVILSACNTAADGLTDSNGLAGLAQAFLYAGGRNLLASHWAVRDDAAAYLSVQTLRRYRRGADPAEALRQSMLRMIDALPIAGADHPTRWAPFVFIGR
jgi:CHAT domain-containing protein